MDPHQVQAEWAQSDHRERRTQITMVTQRVKGIQTKGMKHIKSDQRHQSAFNKPIPNFKANEHARDDPSTLWYLLRRHYLLLKVMPVQLLEFNWEREREYVYADTVIFLMVCVMGGGGIAICIAVQRCSVCLVGCLFVFCFVFVFWNNALVWYGICRIPWIPRSLLRCIVFENVKMWIADTVIFQASTQNAPSRRQFLSGMWWHPFLINTPPLLHPLCLWRSPHSGEVVGRSH